jgi:DNA-binding NtrC family response regulator
MARIVLVDDDEDLRKMLRRVLERAGHEVQEAEDGRVAIELYGKTSSDLIITDLVMPEHEGIQTIVECLRRHPDAKIIAMSGGGRMNPGVNLDAARKLGAVGSLGKPFTHREFVDLVAQVLAEHAGGAPSP